MQKELVHLLFSFTFFCLLTTNTYAANTGKYASNLKFIPIPSSILPTNDVRILYQDSDGYIWLPTYNGLVRYDGYSVVNYGLNDGTNLSFNCYLNVVVEDHDKNLWIAAEKGVFKLHKLTGFIGWKVKKTRCSIISSTILVRMSLIAFGSVPVAG